MEAPPAGLIEAAKDQFTNADYQAKHRAILDAQMKEVQAALPGQPPEFYYGYMLGIETARVLLAGMPAAAMNGVEI